MRSCPFAALLGLFCLAALAKADPFYVEGFNAGNGGYTTSTVSTGLGQWVYGSSGVGGSGAWTTPGGQTGNYPTPLPVEHLLQSPVITVPGPGRVILDFDQLYNFEAYAGPDIWDGGTLMLSVNGGAFTHVPASAFTSNGYLGPLQTVEDWGYAGDLNGVDVFAGSSGVPDWPPLGYAEPFPTGPGVFVHTVAELGGFTGGDTLQLQFLAGYDWFAAASPGWTVDNVRLNAVPEPSSLLLLAAGALGLAALRGRRRRRA